MRSSCLVLALCAASVGAFGCSAWEDILHDDSGTNPPTHRYTGFDAEGTAIASGTLTLDFARVRPDCLGTYAVGITTDIARPTGHFVGSGTVCLYDGPSLPEACVWVLQDPKRAAPFDEVWILEGHCLAEPYPETGSWRRRFSGTFLETGTFRIVPVLPPGR